MSKTTTETITGSTSAEVIRQIEEAMGSAASREEAEHVYRHLGGGYRSEARAVVVEFTPAQWAEAITAAIAAQVA